MRSRAADYNKAGPRTYFDHMINAPLWSTGSARSKPTSIGVAFLDFGVAYHLGSVHFAGGSCSTRSSSNTGSRAPQQGLALMAGWHIPSRWSRDSLLFSLDLLKSAAARFGLRAQIVVLAVRLSRDFRRLN